MQLKLSTAVLVLLPLAATADTVLTTLSERSRVPADELALILADCDSTQRNMNLCSFHMMIAAELRLDRLVMENGMGTAAEHDRFKKETLADCTAKAESEAGSGSMIPLLITSCAAGVYVALHDVIMRLTGALPAPPPGKWD